MHQKKKIIFYIINISLIVVVLSTTFYAWFTKTKVYEVPIDANSAGIEYSIDATTDGEDAYFSIKNLAFFDINKTNELDYFLPMAYKFIVTLKNTGEVDFVYSIQNGQIQSSGPYVTCIITDTALNDATISNLTDVNGDEVITIADILAQSQEVTGTLGKDSTAVSYFCYVIGVQPDENSTNEFLSEKYSFMLRFKFTQDIGGEAS